MTQVGDALKMPGAHGAHFSVTSFPVAARRLSISHSVISDRALGEYIGSGADNT